MEKEMKTWKFSVFANTSDSIACCEVAVQADCEADAFQMAAEHAKSYRVHSDPRVELLGTTDDVRFGEGEKARLTRYRIEHNR